MLPEIDDEELAIYHIDEERDVAVAMYIDRTGLTSNDTNLMVIYEMFDWEWQQRLYGGQEP